MAWIDTENGHYCSDHDCSFSRGDVCAHCTPATSTVNAESSDSELDADILNDAFRYVVNAKRMWSEAETLLDEKGAQDKSVAGKLSDCAIKWERLALEAKDKVAARKHLREAMAHEREMTTARRAH